MRGFKLLRPQVFSAKSDKILDVKQPSNPISDTKKYLFKGLRKCAFPAQKFSSNPERQFAVMLEDDERASIKRWMKPALNQFNVTYNCGQRYNPDFIIETDDEMIIAEVKREAEIGSDSVQMKAEALIRWIEFANQIADAESKKHWRYILVPDNAISATATLDGFKSTYPH